MDFCPQCGEKVGHDGPFCAHCGHEFGDEPGADPDRSTDSGEPTAPDEQRFVPKRQAGRIGIGVGLLSSLGIMIGAVFPLSQSCRYPIGEDPICSTTGGLVNDPVFAILLFLYGAVLSLIILDDYRELGILGSWEPRKTRVYGAYGSVLAVALLIGLAQNEQIALGGLLLLLSSATLVGFSSIVGFWRIGFRKKAGAK